MSGEFVSEEDGPSTKYLIFLNFDLDCPSVLNDYNLVDYECRYQNESGVGDTNGMVEITEAKTYYFIVSTGEWENESPEGYGITGFNSISLKRVV